MQNIVLYKPGEQSWVRYIRKRIKHNLNFLALAEGPTGIGKSWSMISVAHMVDPEFEARQVVFSFKQVMEVINADWFKKKKWKIILFDEAQTDISAREWQSLTNKLMNHLLSTFRHQNIILLFTSPYSDFLDSNSMKLMHCKFEVQSHSRKTQLTHIRPKLLQYNSKMKKFYHHSLYVMRGGATHKLRDWKVAKPPQSLIEPYEKAKTDFTDRLNRRILAELTKAENDKNPSIDVARTDYQRKIVDLLETKDIKDRNELNDKLSEDFYSDLPKISRAIKQLRKNGLHIEL